MRLPIHRTAFLLIPAVLLLLSDCGKREYIPSDDLQNPEDQAIYELVGIPCGEGDYDTAIRRADSLLAQNNLSDSLRAFIMIDRNVATLEKGDIERGVPAIDTLIDFGKRKHIGIAVMLGLQNRGIMKRRAGDHEGAIADYSEGMETAILENNKEMEQIFSEMLAIICVERGRIEESRKYCTQSLRLAHELGDTFTLVNVASTLGAILAKNNEFKAAIDTLLPYRQAVDKTARPLLTIKYLTPLMRSYLSLDSLDRVRELLATAREAVKPYPDSRQVQAVVVNTMAELAGKEGRYSEEWELLRKADSIGTLGSAQDVIFETRASCLANLGRYKEAYDYERKAYEAAVSARKAETDANLSELTVEYETLKKDMEIQKLETSRWLWATVALGCVVVLGIVTISFVSARRKANLRQQREREQEYIKGLEQERGRMARELHDDIAGSLIGLQWEMENIPPDETARRISEIGHRVRTLSHEMMPPEFTRQPLTVLLLDYAARFNASHDSFSIAITDEGSFDWNSLPSGKSHELYRIVQESINNAVRHGSPGEIRITLGGDVHFELTIENPMPPHEADESDGSRLRTLKARTAILDAALDTEARGNTFKLTIRQKR